MEPVVATSAHIQQELPASAMALESSSALTSTSADADSAIDADIKDLAPTSKSTKRIHDDLGKILEDVWSTPFDDDLEDANDRSSSSLVSPSNKGICSSISAKGISINANNDGNNHNSFSSLTDPFADMDASLAEYCDQRDAFDAEAISTDDAAIGATIGDTMNGNEDSNTVCVDSDRHNASFGSINLIPDDDDAEDDDQKQERSDEPESSDDRTSNRSRQAGLDTSNHSIHTANTNSTASSTMSSSTMSSSNGSNSTEEHDFEPVPIEPSRVTVVNKLDTNDLIHHSRQQSRRNSLSAGYNAGVVNHDQQVDSMLDVLRPLVLKRKLASITNTSNNNNSSSNGQAAGASTNGPNANYPCPSTFPSQLPQKLQQQSFQAFSPPTAPQSMQTLYMASHTQQQQQQQQQQQPCYNQPMQHRRKCRKVSISMTSMASVPSMPMQNLQQQHQQVQQQQQQVQAMMQQQQLHMQMQAQANMQARARMQAQAQMQMQANMQQRFPAIISQSPPTANKMAQVPFAPQFQLPLVNANTNCTAHANMNTNTNTMRKDTKAKSRNASEPKASRIRCHQEVQWDARFQELLDFKAKNGHCSVPHSYEINPQLAQWVKRQRYQFKLKMEGRHSTLTNERQVALEEVQFIWDSHHALWEERFGELIEYKRDNGHCIVPARYKINPPLAVWVKCQRRQFKLLNEGQRTNITQQRIDRLNSIGFCWNPRNVV